MTTPQPDKAGLHILLKLASLVVILAGIHAAADIIVQLLLALFFRHCPQSTGHLVYPAGSETPGGDHHCGGRDAVRAHRADWRAGGLGE